MSDHLELKKRHHDEQKFFNNKAESILEVDGKTFLLNNRKTYEELFSEIPQFRPVVEFFGNIAGKKLLDLGCGDGWTSLYFARSDADVFSVDISPKSIELVRKYAKANGLDKNITAKVMPAEHLVFEDNFFDFVFMNAALHHCDVEIVAREIQRVLKPSGRAAVIEDFAYHPLMNLYRIFTRGRHTRYEKPLDEFNVDIFCNAFRDRSFTFTGLINIFGSKRSITRSYLQYMDDIILNTLPSLKKYCRIIGIYVSK